MVSIKIICLLLTPIWSKTDLPRFATKQLVDNIRFISSDSKTTYYVAPRSGLNVSTNYTVQNILKGTPLDDFTIHHAKGSKYVAIAQQKNFHQYFSPFREKDIYVSIIGSLKATKIDTGLFPKIHPQLEWLSYLKLKENKIVFYNLKSAQPLFNIPLPNNSPLRILGVQRIVLNNRKVLYSVRNEEDSPLLNIFDRGDSKNTTLTIYNKFQRIELCENGTSNFLGLFGLDPQINKSQIFSISFLKNEFIEKSLYLSEQNDLGQMKCNTGQNDHLYFIKKYNDGVDIAQLNINNSDLKRISHTKNAERLINLDGNLLTQIDGVAYVIKGISNVKDSDNLSN